MASRVKYIRLKHTFEDHERKDADSCGHCGARVYLEGLCGAHATSSSAIAAPTGPQPSTPKKRRLSAADVVKELADAKALKDAGLLSSPELRDLKDRLLQGSLTRARTYSHIHKYVSIFIHIYVHALIYMYIYVFLLIYVYTCSSAVWLTGRGRVLGPGHCYHLQHGSGCLTRSAE